jgi:hypothetical protein
MGNFLVFPFQSRIYGTYCVMQGKKECILDVLVYLEVVANGSME